MFNRYQKEKRDGPSISEAEKEIKTKLDSRRLDRHKRVNADYAARASKRVENWMVDEAELPKPEAEPNTNPFAFEFRYRNKDKEFGKAPGDHTLSARRYTTQAERIEEAERLSAMATRGDFQEQKYGESPFRKRVKGEEIHPPLRYKDVTEAERINASTSGNTTGLGPGADPLKDAIMGFDDIPCGMRPDTVVVRAKAKCPGTMQFKRCFRNKGMLNPPDKYVSGEKYLDAAEPSGYGFTSKNNFRPRRRQHEIDQSKEFLSGSKGGLIMGTTTSKRVDRMSPVQVEKPERKFYCAARTMVVMSEDSEEVVQSKGGGEPETRVALATRMLKQQGVNKSRHFESSNTCSNGPNIYAWNELMKFKDHKM